MNDLVFLDTETTGINLFSDYLFQVAYSYKGKLVSEYFKPPLPISIKAQSITHITNKVVSRKAAFKNSKMRQSLNEILKDNILVAHNAPFDIYMLSKEGVETSQFICTLKVARFLDQSGEIPEYNLQFLRYYFELNINASAHSAEGDVLVLEALFKELLSQMLKKCKNKAESLDKMIQVSKEPFVFRKFPFGKYRGRSIEEVAKLDRKYLEWLLEQKTQNPLEEEDWIFTLKKNLKKD